METFLERLILKKEGRLHFPLSAIFFEILISQILQLTPMLIYLFYLSSGGHASLTCNILKTTNDIDID
jgi:hypothetical protein